jgi:hypothetical protein
MRSGRAAELDDVGKALGGDQRGAGAGAFEEGVRRHRHAVSEALDVFGRNAGAVQHRPHRLHHGLGLVVRRRWRLARVEPVAGGEDGICEGPVDVDAQEHTGRFPPLPFLAATRVGVMKLIPVVLVVLAAGFVLAPTTSAQPAWPQSGHYVGEASNGRGESGPVTFDAHFTRGVVTNFRFGPRHLPETASIHLRHNPHGGDYWAFAENSEVDQWSLGWYGEWNGAREVIGQVAVTNKSTGTRVLFTYRAHTT